MATPGTEASIERAACLRFDHPFAAIAVTDVPPSVRGGIPVGARPGFPNRFCGLPVFEAWVHSPTEVSDFGDAWRVIEELVSQRRSPAGRTESDWLGRLLFMSLPDNEHIVMRAHYCEGLSLAEIAEGLYVSESDVEAIHDEAVMDLRAMLSAELPE
jgi:hypothetical protein